MIDVAVIGAGPAGLSAAINVRARGKSVLVISNPIEENPLYKAHRVDNYPGLPGVSGAQLLQTLEKHARDSGVQFRVGRVLSATPMGKQFFLSIGGDIEEARSIVVAIGTQRGVKLPGEEALLGRGVSWCATCDGMLYRGKQVVVVGLSHDAPAEANFLQEIGCQVLYVSGKPTDALRQDVPVILGKQISIEGEQTVTAVKVDETLIPCSGAFVLRETMAPADLLPSLALKDGYVAVDRAASTSIPGIFACGDCTGLPLQIANAVGEGLVAGQNAAEYVDHLKL